MDELMALKEDHETNRDLVIRLVKLARDCSDRPEQPDTN